MSPRASFGFMCSTRSYQLVFYIAYVHARSTLALSMIILICYVNVLRVQDLHVPSPVSETMSYCVRMVIDVSEPCSVRTAHEIITW